MNQDQMKSFIGEQLIIIDKLLAKQDIPLNSRPFKAAVFFVNECITKIEGDSKDDFWEKEWFGDFYHWIEDWYKKRYGDAIKREELNTIGIVRIFDTPFVLNIPLWLSGPGDQENTFWLTFPNDIMPDETPHEWLSTKPNLDQLSKKELDLLNKDIDFVASSLRSIYVNLSTASCSTSLRKLRGSISTHLEKAVQDILSNYPAQVSVAYWEIHFAIEKTIKLFLKQKGITHPNIHDLIKLRKKAESEVNTTELDKSFAKCPNAKQVNKYRYGENQDVSADDAIEFYYAALRIITFYTKALHRKIGINNGRILFRPLPWA